jgi:hypothetical protein
MSESAVRLFGLLATQLPNPISLKQSDLLLLVWFFLLIF